MDRVSLGIVEIAAVGERLLDLLTDPRCAADRDDLKLAEAQPVPVAASMRAGPR
ncbi:MAG TPA: hypothetical protein VKM93_10790 [Terriglobia bacterium]|nr:hypothetical protein [Terriglobia bacterium]